MKKELKDKYVYLHRDVNNTIFYVGVGGRSRHKVTQTRSNLWKDVSKGGYTIEKYKKGITMSEAFEIEIDLIELIGRKDLGLGTLVNKTNGGAGTIGALRGGSKNGMYGKVHSKETRQKIREYNLGKKRTKESIEEQRIRQTGKKRSISYKNWELLLEDFSNIDKMVHGVTYKHLAKKYGVQYSFVKNWYNKLKKTNKI